MTGRRVPEDKREIFKERLGSELKESELINHKDTKIITVGDVVSLTMIILLSLWLMSSLSFSSEPRRSLKISLLSSGTLRPDMISGP